MPSGSLFSYTYVGVHRVLKLCASHYTPVRPCWVMRYMDRHCEGSMPPSLGGGERVTEKRYRNPKMHKGGKGKKCTREGPVRARVSFKLAHLPCAPLAGAWRPRDARARPQETVRATPAACQARLPPALAHIPGCALDATLAVVLSSPRAHRTLRSVHRDDRVRAGARVIDAVFRTAGQGYAGARILCGHACARCLAAPHAPLSHVS